ncbi:hydantoinase/oxoprolinase family protein [Nocardia arthritidis]|uniref:hydantoinase/oxoprolinase family protein n=1 Tax=Nocardia arthritidis TaxID=228602 RepID=UPI0007A53934|nr:hydantoinase/oxoprolinase family protein [Nocardia arthritidis]
MASILGIDIGGTFTDAFLGDDKGNVTTAKVPSTPPNFAEGLLNAVDEIGRKLGRPREKALADVDFICHGTTAALNALVTGNVARVGLLTTKGHRDSIYIMNVEGRYAGLGSHEIQDVTGTRKPPPLIPKRMVKEITERIDYQGEVVVPLDEEVARSAIRELLAEGVDAIAVSLLWSFVNPEHEQRLRKLVEQESPATYVCLSSEVAPKIREYTRTVTTVMNAQVGPTLRDYLAPLQDELAARGLSGPLMVMQGSGGSVSAQNAPAQAITTIGSVLTGGVVGARNLGQLLGHRNIITSDIGGTTFLVGLVVDGEPVFANTTTLNQFTISTPMMKVTSIGSGGGAIAWLDGSNLRVGPRSAGARPGPACYGQDGSEPTVTDANLVLGILDPDTFAEGTRKLDVERARQAIGSHIAEPLGLGVEEAAAAIFEIQNAQTADLLRSVVVGQGHDPRDFVLYAFGGGGPAHCFAYGGDLGIQEIYIPLGDTNAFSAYGLTTSDVVLSAEMSDPASHPFDASRVHRQFDELEQTLNERLNAQGMPFTEIEMRRELDIRYTAQMFEVPTPVRAGELGEGDMEQVIADFEALYAKLFGTGTGYRDAGYQLINHRVFGIGRVGFKPQLPTLAEIAPPDAGATVRGTRPVFLDSRLGWEDTAIYDYQQLTHGHTLTGPAIVEAGTTTVVVPRGGTARVDALRNIVLHLDDRRS